MTDGLRAQFADYAAHHATPGNKACHTLGIPLIVVTLVALLARVPLAEVGGFTVTAAEAVIAVVTLYYLTLDVPLGLLMLGFLFAASLVGRLLPLPAAIALFVAGWVLQFIGHYVYEKRSPAFFRNLVHLLVGPLWILARAVGRA